MKISGIYRKGYPILICLIILLAQICFIFPQTLLGASGESEGGGGVTVVARHPPSAAPALVDRHGRAAGLMGHRVGRRAAPVGVGRPATASVNNARTQARSPYCPQYGDRYTVPRIGSARWQARPRARSEARTAQ